MYRCTQDFIHDFKIENEITLNMFKHINSAALGTKVYEGGREMHRLIWHIALTLSEMMQSAGLQVEGAQHDATMPNSIEEICDSYLQSAQSVISAVVANWKDENLLDEILMYGEMWKKGTVLSILIRHEAHHRGQLTVLMRQAGLIVPGAYGPSKEEWIKLNMNPPL